MVTSISRVLAVGGTLALLSGPASAISEYNSMATACAKLKAIVDAEGAVLFRWNDPTRRYSFGRFVTFGPGYCDAHEEAATTFIPAADTRHCPVLECKPAIVEHRSLNRR